MDKKIHQNRIKVHFDQMYKSGITPWKDHPLEPTLVHFIKFLKERYPSGKLLDLGCGDGWISLQVAKVSFVVWGIDSSETAISRAKNSAHKEKLNHKMHFQTGDALDLPYANNFFDALIDRGLFHHILPISRSVYKTNILRVLKKHSYVYLAVFSTNNPQGIGQLFTKKLIEDFFHSHFSIIFFDQDPYPTEAPAHLLHVILKRRK